MFVLSDPGESTLSFDPSAMNVWSTTVLWEGATSDLTSMASGGRLTSAAYKITEDAIVFASGVVSNREETVPLWAVRDVDYSQGIAQRTRGVADLTLKLDPQAEQHYGQRVLVLRAIKDAKRVRDIVLQQANAVRNYWNQRLHDRDIEQRRAGAMNFGMAAPAAQPAAQPVSTPSGGDDLMAKLGKLGEMKQAGLLSDDEFAAAKAKLLS